MELLSVIIPTRNEQFLKKTVADVFDKAEGKIEVIVSLDGYWTDTDSRCHVVHCGEPYGMRWAINSAVRIARGEYILKTDAHCMFDKGFDVKLIKDCRDKCVCVPTRKRLDAESWSVQAGKPDIDYMYLSYPDDSNDFGGAGLHGREWRQKNTEQSLKNDKIVDLMSFQGSCWMMKKAYFHELELMDDDNYGSFWKEAQEIGLKAWLSGGRVIRNKNTWYAHLHKGKKYGRGYFLDKRTTKRANDYTNKWLTGDAWDKQTLPFSWLIKKFSPVPEWDNERISKQSLQEK